MDNNELTHYKERGRDALSRLLNNELSHGDWEEHKYVAKVKVGDSYRYFYDKDEYNTYLKSQENIGPSPTPEVKAKLENKIKLNQKKQEVFDNKPDGFLSPDDVLPPLSPKQIAMREEKKAINDEAGPRPKNFESLKAFSITDIPSDKSINDFNQEQVNPKYQTVYDHFGDTPYTINCAYCTAAYELRCRGYDVVAAPYFDEEKIGFEDNLNINTEVFEWYKKPKVKALMADGITLQQKDADKFCKEVLKYGEGARGSLHLYWAFGSAHSVAWSVENGEVIIRDCQTNMKYTALELFKRASACEYYRTDNLELTDRILKAVRNRK